MTSVSFPGTRRNGGGVFTGGPEKVGAAQLPASVVKVASPNLANVALEAATPLFPRLMADLSLGQLNKRLAIVTDSTGTDVVAEGSPATGWVKRVAQWIASQFPAYTVNYYTWTDSGFSGGLTGNVYEVDTLHLVSGASGSTILNFTWRGTVYTTTAINFGVTAAQVANIVNNTIAIPGAFAGSGGPFGSGDVILTAQGPLLGPVSSLGHADTTLVCTFTQTTPGSGGTVLQTGTNGAAAPVLDVFNAAVAGTNATWFQGQRAAVLAALQPNAIGVSFGHNSLSDTSLQWWNPYLALCEDLIYGASHAELGLFAQNPEVAPAANTTQQQARATDVLRLGKLLGAPVVNICQAFIDTGNPAAYINADGIHPNGGNSGGMALWATVTEAHLAKGVYAKATAPTVPARAKTASNLIQNGSMQINGGVLNGWALTNITLAQDSTHFERAGQGYSAKLTATAQTSFGASISQTLDAKQCAGKWVTLMVRYYAPSGQADNVNIGRFQISDGVKDAVHSLSNANGQQRDAWCTAVVSLLVDPNATNVQVLVYATVGTSANEVGANISVQDVTAVIGQEPMGLPWSAPAGAGSSTVPLTQADPLLGPAIAAAPKLLLPLAGDTIDYSANNNGASSIVTAVYGAGRVGIAKALTFDGSTQYLTTAYQPFATGGVTRTFFGLALRTNTAAGHTLFGGDNGAASHHPALRINTGGEDVRWWTDVGNDATHPTWTAAWPGTGQWVAWALIAISLTSAELYINGVSEGVVADANDYTAGNNLQIGARATVDKFNGSQTLFGVVEGALSATQIGKIHGYITGSKGANAALTALIAQAVSVGTVMTDATS